MTSIFFLAILLFLLSFFIRILKRLVALFLGMAVLAFILVNIVHIPRSELFGMSIAPTISQIQHFVQGTMAPLHKYVNTSTLKNIKSPQAPNMPKQPASATQAMNWFHSILQWLSTIRL